MDLRGSANALPKKCVCVGGVIKVVSLCRPATGNKHIKLKLNWANKQYKRKEIAASAVPS